MTIGVTPVRPARPQIVDQLVHGLVGVRRPWPDAGANEAVDQNRHGFRGDRVVADQIAHPVTQDWSCQTDLCICGFAICCLAICAAVFGGHVIGPAQISQRDPCSIAL